MFDAKTVKNQCVRWIQEFFRQNGPDCNAIVGISGGKDSSVVAALCVVFAGGALAYILLRKKPGPETLYVNRMAAEAEKAAQDGENGENL